MKAIYTILNGVPYRMTQNTRTPFQMTTYGGACKSSLVTDPTNGYATQVVEINTLEVPGTCSNKEKFDNLVEYLKKYKIKKICNVSNHFAVHIEYILYSNCREIDHAVLIQPFEPTDKILPLGVSRDSETVYRQVKSFHKSIEFNVARQIPYGIMKSNGCRNNYEMKIVGIKIYQYVKDPNPHCSSYMDPYDMFGTNIVEDDLERTICAFTTEEFGIKFQPITFNFEPRKVCIDLNVVLTDYIVCYDDTVINKILDDNQDEEPGPDPTPIPEEDKHKPADGDEEPDEYGYFDYYERCRATTPHALKVVESTMTEGFDNDTMIHIDKVVKDIPDIAVNEYVIYREAVIDFDIN